MATFKAFDTSVYNILKMYLYKDEYTPELFKRIENDIKLSITPEARAEMMIYTDKIEIQVTGTIYYHRHGWLWRKRTAVRRYLSAHIVFEPYGSSLSVWTDPTAPGGIVCFQ